MSRHDGVSCDSCLKSNFRGKRFKCLICYDYDLCATCFEAGATTTRHTAEHSVQCIITRSDFDIFYGGESVTAEHPQAFSCPFCTKMGYTEALLQEHVTMEHAETSVKVVCPICASVPGGDPNHVTDDFAAHLTLEHRAPREFDESTSIRHVRRIPHPGRGVTGARTRRATNMHFASGGSALTGLSPSGREGMDPIAELLSQLSSVRSRAAAAQSVSSQLQQLEMQLQSTRQQLERLPRRQAEAAKTASAAGVTVGVTTNAPESHVAPSSAGNNNNSISSSMFLLSRCTESAIEENMSNLSLERSCRSLFIQELLLSTLLENLNLTEYQLDNFDKISETVSTFDTSLVLSKVEKSDMVEDAAAAADKENSNFNAGKNLVDVAGFSEDAMGVCDETLGYKSVLDKVGTKQKVAIGVTVQSNGKGANNTGGSRGVNQSSIQYHSQGERNNPAVLNMREGGVIQNVNRGSGSSSLGYNNEPHPLPGRPGSGGRDREGRLTQPTTKRNMVKHLSSTKASDREPPPH